MGYDVDRFKDSDINQEFICGICHDVLKSPLVIDNCEHIFCSECINQWIKEIDSCPVDRNKISSKNLLKPLRSFINLLNELEINCEYASLGCKLYIKLGELEVHKNNCTFNPSKNILCNCDLIIASNYLIEHQNNCLEYFKEQLKGALTMINDMKTKNRELEIMLEEAAKETSIISEWHRVKELNISLKVMPRMVYDRLTEILTDSLNRKIFNNNQLCEKFCNEFGGNWNIFTGQKLSFNEFLCESVIIYKVGKFDIIIFMNTKPIYDVLIAEKLIKSVDKGINQRVWDENMMNVWSLLYNLTDDSLNISERLLDKNITKYFIECYVFLTSTQQGSFYSMIGVFTNISEFKELRHRLMDQKFLSIVLELTSNQNNITSYLSCQLLSNILSEGKDFWKKYIKNNQVLNRDLIKAQLKHKISGWKLDSDFLALNFTTLKPFNRLILCNDNIPQEVHYFAVWTLAYLIRKDCKRYCRLLREDDCITVLENLIKYSRIDDHVKNLAKLVLNQNRLYSENGNLDKLLDV